MSSLRLANSDETEFLLERDKPVSYCRLARESPW